MTDPDPVITIRDLSFRYPPAISGRSVTALSHISTRFHAGELAVITGPSGSGKSTLTRCLNGLIPHATEGTMDGDVVVLGRNTKDYGITDFSPDVGMVFQDPGYQVVTGDVTSEIAFGLEVQNLPEQEIRVRVDDTAELLHISHLKGRLIGELSWGERQRVAIASVLAVQPAVLVMDEPFSGLDADAAGSLARHLARIRERTGTTVIIFEHRAAILRKVASRWIVMYDGTIVSDRTIEKQEAPATIAWRGPCKRYPPPGPLPVSRTKTPTLSLRDVAYQYPGQTVPALHGITTDFYPGEVTVVMGANGSGKTTLLKLCNGLLAPDHGCIFLGADPLSGMTVAAATRTVGLLNQHADYQIFEGTIAEELAFGPKNLGRTDDYIRETVSRVHRLCSLDHIDPATPPLGLSGGEKQRVALAGILAMETPVLLLDEPTFGLDPALKQGLLQILRALCRENRTVIVATHDDEFSRECGDRFIRITAGRIEEVYPALPEAPSGNGENAMPEKPHGG